MEPTSSYNGLFRLDRIHRSLKWLNIFVCLGFVLLIDFWLRDNNLVNYRVNWGWLPVLAPSFIAVAWLRLTGIRWRYVMFFPIIAASFVRVVWFLYMLLALLASDLRLW